LPTRQRTGTSVSLEPTNESVLTAHEPSRQ
jgi:hypothetical protein